MSRAGLSALLLFVPVTCAVAATYDCPAGSPQDAGHKLVNASLFDGPPEQMADLVPDPVQPVARWDLDGVDPYLVCRYAGTEKTVVLHAQGARTCEAGGKPFRAGCR